MKKILFRLLPVSMLFWPAVVMAQGVLPVPRPGIPGGAPRDVTGLVILIENVAGFAFWGLIIGAFAMWLVGAFFYLGAAASADSKEKAKNFLIYGAVAAIIGFASFAIGQVIKTMLGAI